MLILSHYMASRKGSRKKRKQREREREREREELEEWCHLLLVRTNKRGLLSQPRASFVFIHRAESGVVVAPPWNRHKGGLITPSIFFSAFSPACNQATFSFLFLDPGKIHQTMDVAVYSDIQLATRKG